jgi:hypothetical protein
VAAVLRRRFSKKWEGWPLIWDTVSPGW